MSNGTAALTTLTIFCWVTPGWTTSAAAVEPNHVPPAAPSPAPEPTAPETTPVYEVVPRLVPPADECLDHWWEVLGEPSSEERHWREQLNHGIYRIGLGDTPLARVELLSSASPAVCGVDPDWRMRQTQILVTYYLTDGGTHEVLYELLEDDVFYNQSPRIQAEDGIVVLRGVGFDGSDVHITLELDLLRELYRAAAPVRAAPQRPTLSASRNAARGLTAA